MKDCSTLCCEEQYKTDAQPKQKKKEKAETKVVPQLINSTVAYKVGFIKFDTESFSAKCTFARNPD